MYAEELVIPYLAMHLVDDHRNFDRCSSIG